MYSLELDLSLLGAIGVEAGAPAGAVFGGDIVGSCTSPCSLTKALGGLGVVRANYEFPSRFGLGAQVGYFVMESKAAGRTTNLTSSTDKTPTGKPVVDNGLATDALTLGGLALGGSAFYRLGSVWPFTMRVTGGIILGAGNDGRTGDFVTSGGSKYTVTTSESPTAIYLYASPEIRLGRRLSEHFEVSVGVEVPILIAAQQPRWTTQSVGIPLHAPGKAGDGTGAFPEETIAGGLLVTVAPSIGGTYIF